MGKGKKDKGIDKATDGGDGVCVGGSAVRASGDGAKGGAGVENAGGDVNVVPVGANVDGATGGAGMERGGREVNGIPFCATDASPKTLPLSGAISREFADLPWQFEGWTTTRSLFGTHA